jgi:hypothetical protein
MQSFCDTVFQFIQVVRFHYIEIGCNRFHIISVCIICGTEADRQMIKPVFDLLSKIEAVIISQPDIENNQIGAFFFNFFHEPESIGYCNHLVSCILQFL